MNEHSMLLIICQSSKFSQAVLDTKKTNTVLQKSVQIVPVMTWLRGKKTTQKTTHKTGWLTTTNASSSTTVCWVLLLYNKKKNLKLFFLKWLSSILKTNPTNLHKAAVYTIYSDRKIIHVKYIKILKQYFYLSNTSLHSWSLAEQRTLKKQHVPLPPKPRNLKSSTLSKTWNKLKLKSATTLIMRLLRQLLKLQLFLKFSIHNSFR